MAITVKHSKTSTVPDGADTSLVRPSDWNADHTLTGLGTMAEQDASNVAITGGSVNGTSLGATTAASAKVTTLDIGSGLTLATNAGSAGQVLTSAGAGNVPTWSTNGAGDVVGPASSTDNAVARFDLTTGKLIQNSVVIVDDSGNVTGVNSITDPDYITFNTSYATSLTAGQLGWDGNNTLGLGMAGGNVTQHIGEDQFFYCKASSAITKGEVVMFTGAVGASGVPTGAPATGITDGTYIMGVAAESIALNGFGLVQSFGTLRNVNTTGYADGDILWYDPTVTGGLTKTKPSAPNVKAQMAAVINGGSSGGGTILIRIDPGSQLGGTDSNVQISSLTGGQLLSYSSADSYWKNTNLAAGTGISVNSATNGVITVTNSSPMAYPGAGIANSTGSAWGTSYTTSGSGTVLALTTSPSFTTPILGTPQSGDFSTGTFTWPTFNQNTTGNAGTVTNGVYTTGSYADPTWITSLAGSKITGTISGGTF
jgi:hypothetical protein